MNSKFKKKLTPEHNEPVNAQNIPTKTNLKDYSLVELALMQEYEVVTTLPYRKSSSPIFAQGKPNRKQRLLVDLRRINHLLKNDYNQHNHPMADNNGRCGTTHGWQTVFLRAYLFASISLVADDRRTVNSTACIQLWKQKFCIPPIDSGLKLLTVSLQ